LRASAAKPIVRGAAALDCGLGCAFDANAGELSEITRGTMSEADEARAQPASAPAAGYRVLARKYRPATFDDLIGQEAMVRTITNAFETGRIPQAWILTGVRGVGKTTTARILARGLNYALPDGSITAPTVRMPTMGLHCQAIMDSRHVDVLEMDAASHNGVDDIRQINDAVRYAPVDARYKVYILDEVHMLSTAAFNALLKTLEEPPPHAKFIFATTEIREVPVTVLSRCQRFDLRRVETSRLVSHLEGILAKEGVSAEPEALTLIARAAEGSVRDSLSILDQAISHAAGAVRAEDVRSMLGLADRSRIIELFDALMKGDIARALAELRDQYDSGADPLVVLTDLAEFTHFVTRVKVVPAVANDRSLAEIERTRGRDFAAGLSMRVLSRTWQMLFKGIAEVKEAPRPIAAAEMVLVRIAYAADLPSPEDVARSLGDAQRQAAPAAGRGASAPRPAAPVASAEPATMARQPALLTTPRPTIATTAALSSPSPLVGEGRGGGSGGYGTAVPHLTTPTPDPSPQGGGEKQSAGVAAQLSQPLSAPAAAAPSRAFAKFEDLIAYVGEKRDLPLKAALERDVRLVNFEDGKIEIALEASASKALIGDLARRLGMLTGRRWMVVVSTEAGRPTVRSQIDAQQEEFRRGVQTDPLVQSVLARFPGAQIIAVRQSEAEASPAGPAAGEEEAEPPIYDDGSAFGAHGLPDDVDDDF
jgi:DNA polymerase III subunit gamma/tau